MYNTSEKFKTLFPELPEIKREELRKEFSENGINITIPVWKEENLIIGHYDHYEIATELNLTLRPQMLSFANEGDAIGWVVKSEICRNHLNKFQILEAIDKCSAGGKFPRKQLIKLSEINRTYVDAFKFIKTHASHETKEKLRSGVFSISAGRYQANREKQIRESTYVSEDESHIEDTKSNMVTAIQSDKEHENCFY